MNKFTFRKLSLLLSLIFTMSFTGWTQCTHTLEMIDSYGDGWNGASVTVLVNGVPALTAATFTSGYSSTATFTAANGDAITTTWSTGSYDSECTYNILDGAGIVIGSDGPTPTGISTPISGSCPTCPPPSGLSASNITDSSAQLSWTTGGATMWNLEYGPLGFTQGTGTLIQNVSNPYTLTGLAGSTSYDFYVQDSCAVNDVSIWAGPYTFNTALGGLPYYESFETNTFGLWSQVTYDDYDWSLNSGSTGSSNTGPSSASDGTYYIYTETSGPPYGSQFVLESPNFNFTSEPGPAMVFDYHMYFNNANDGTLSIDATTDGITWTTVWTMTGDQGQNWHTAIVNLSAYIGQPSVTIRLNFTSGFTAQYNYHYDIGIDNIALVNITCYPSSNLSVSNIQNTSAVLDWTTGGATSWLLEYGGAGFTPGTGTLVNVSSKPYTLTNLQQGTAFDFYVQDICSPTDSSIWVGPETFVTTASPLNGVYTIGDTTGGVFYDFPTISAAATYLSIGGVSGAVTFNIATGVYDEQVYFDSIPGASALNTVTFQSATGDSTDVTVQYAAASSSDNWVIGMNNAEYLTLQNMSIKGIGSSYGRAIVIGDEVKNLTVSNCLIETSVASSSNFVPIYANGVNNNFNTFQNNVITGGYYGIYWYGNSSNYSTNNSFLCNDVLDFYYYGTYLYYTDTTVFDRNNFKNANNSGTVYGIRLYYGNNSTITNNYVSLAGTSTHYGIYLRGAGTATEPNIIANNAVNLMGTGTSTWYGLYVYYADYTDVYHNTVNMDAGSTTSRGIYTSQGSYINILNNILSVPGGGYTMYISTTAAIASSNNNVLYTTGSNIGYWSGTKTTLADWQTASTFDGNSVDFNPVLAAPLLENLTPLSASVDNIGTPISSITTDIFGNPRSATTPDAGAIEFTGISSDIAIIDGLIKNGECLSTNDSVFVTISNVIGGAINFATNPLTVGWDVTGPVNSNGTIVVNSGTLNPSSDTIIEGNGVDLSVPGIYTLSIYIQPNTINVYDGNDTLLNQFVLEVYNPFYVEPAYTVITNTTDTVELSAKSRFFPGGDFFITEVCHYKTSTGQPVGGWPAYLIADDYIEVTGVPGSDLAGFTLEQWKTTMDVSFTFLPGTVMGPNGTAIIAVGQMGSSVESPANFYYHGNGTFTGTYGSSTDAGRILKDASGNIVDAVGYNGYTFPAAANVPASEWSNSLSGGGSSSGIRLEGPDVNSGTNWVLSASSPQDPNTVNSGVTVPSPGTLTGFTWSYNSVVTSTNNVDTVVGPFTTSGRYEYVASYNTPCGILQDTAVIDVLLPLVISDDTTICQGEGVDLTVEFPGTGPWTLVVSDGGPTDTITGITGPTFTHTDTPMVTTTYYVHSYWGTNNFIVDNFDSATVTVIPTPLVDLGPDHTICEGDSVTLSAAGPIATDLIFSEYGEGSSNNKAIELFNGTRDTIDLANYRINQSVNGGGWQYEHYFPAGAKLNPGQTWVMVANQMSSTYFDIALADEVLSYPSVVNHNGDDARGLEVTTDSGTTWTLIDIIGDPNNDPGTGWDVAGVSSATANHTLIRKPEVLAPNTDWLVVAGTDPASSEYIVHPVNYYDNLGMHTMNIDFGVGNTYLWSNGDSTESITVMPTTTTTYSVTVTNAAGCYSVDSVTIHVNPTPVVNLGPNTTFCNTESLTLDAGAGFASYLWSDLSTGQTLVLDSFNLTVGTHTISVTVTDSNGCEGVGTVDITMADCTSLNELALSNALKFYPNPNTGNFFMEVNGINGEMIIRMTNTTGHMIYNETINVTGQMMKELHIEGAAAGLYYLQVIHNGSRFTEKIIVK